MSTRDKSEVEMKIEGKEFAIKDVFSDNFAFSVPNYQRPYAWEEQEAGELLDDLIQALGHSDDKIDDLPPYFLGSIVLIKQDGKPEAQVVDGQQRLTTLTILLAAIRDALGEKGEQLQKFLYEQGNEFTSTPDRYRVRLRPRDQVFFQSYIQERRGSIETLENIDPTALPESQQNIRTNASSFIKKLKADLDETKRYRLAQYILGRCFLVAVWTPDLDSAYQTFTVLNDRGLDLLPCDILKAEIVGKVSSNKVDDYNLKWEATEEALGRERFNELFTHIRMTRRKTKPEEALLKEFRAMFLKQLPEDLINKVIIPYGDAFGIIRKRNYQASEKADQVNDLFHWLNRIDGSDWVPPAIRFLSENKSKPLILLKFFQNLERLAAFLFITRVDRRARIERYGRVITAIDENNDLYSTNSPLQLTEAERKELRSSLNGSIYTQNNLVRQYILLRLDSVLVEGGAKYGVQDDTVSIEHVLPQNPSKSSQWLKTFPDEEQRNQLTHCLGNLVLLSRRKNTDAQNYEFPKKIEVYFFKNALASPFMLTNEVRSHQDWNPQIILDRQKKYVEKLSNLWSLTGPLLPA